VDFIARAGSLIDRGHRIIGILLVVVIVQLVWVQTERGEKHRLQELVDYQNKSQSIYVVPNSQAGVYKPAEGKLLLSTFVDYLTQNLLTYTPANVSKQYKSIRKFLSSKMLSSADTFYRDEIKKSRVERLSSLFIADRTSTELDEFVELSDNKYGQKTYEINVRGIRNIVVGGRVLEAKNMSIKLQLQETAVSKTNPFGFVVTKMELTKIRQR